MIRAGGLWLRDSKKTGEKFMVGTLGGVKVLVFKNKQKRSDKDPDYILCFDHAPTSRGEAPEPDTEG